MTPLRVVVITQEDPFYIAEFFRAFLSDPRLRGGAVTVTGAWILHTLGQKSRFGLLQKMYGLYGAADLARLIVRYGRKRIAAELFRRAGRGRPVTVAQLLAHAGIPVHESDDINAPAALEALRAERPDVLLSISATQKFSPELLSIPRLGCFNSHSGDLPRFRGMMPTFWTLYEDEPAATVTLHSMAPKLDDGAIWRQERIPLDRSMSLDDVIVATKRLSARMMWTLLDTLASGQPLAFVPNDASRKSYYRFPTAQHAAELRRRGWRLL